LLSSITVAQGTSHKLSQTKKKKPLREDEELLQSTILLLQKDRNWSSWTWAPINLNYHQANKKEKQSKV